MNLIMPSSVTLPLLEKFSASATLVSCILPDEPVLKVFEVSGNVDYTTFQCTAVAILFLQWIIPWLLDYFFLHIWFFWE